MKKIKSTAIILALVMLLGMLAGCGKSPENRTGGTDASVSSEPSASEKPSVSEQTEQTEHPEQPEQTEHTEQTEQSEEAVIERTPQDYRMMDVGKIDQITDAERFARNL